MDSIVQLTAPNLNFDLPQKVIQDLNNLKNTVTLKYYLALEPEWKKCIMEFTVRAIPEIWERGTAPVKFECAAAYGEILMKLAPFEYRAITEYITKEISTLTAGLILQLAGVCFLAKFYNSVEFANLLNDTPFMHLFKFEETERIPSFVKYLKSLPLVFLQNLAEYFVQLFLHDQNNRHYTTAISILTEVEPNKFIHIINENVKPQYIGRFFEKGAPKFPPEKVAVYKEALIKIITDPDPNALDYELACQTLGLLIRSENIDQEEAEAMITKDMILNTKSLTSLLQLPIKEELIRELYTFERPESAPKEEEVVASPLLGNVAHSQESVVAKPDTEPQFGKFECDSAILVPLMEYFTRNLIFTSELVSIIGNSLDEHNKNYSDVLRALGSVCRKIPAEDLNNLLTKAFSVNSSNWIHALWTLKLIGKLDFTRMSKTMTERAFVLIEDAVVSPTDKLHETGCQVVLKIKNTLPFDQFKIFVDKFIRKLDIFNPSDFERRISFLAHTFYNMTGGWTLSFMHIATMVSEAMSIFDFSPKTLEGVFYILAVFSANMRNIENTMYFTRHALGVICSQYQYFTGYQLELPSCPLAKTVISHNIPLKKIDSDITSRPEASHRQLMSTALIALVFLSKVQWGEMPMDESDVALLAHVATVLAPLFIDECLRLAVVLLDCPEAKKEHFEKFISTILQHIHTKRQKLGIITVIECASMRLGINQDDYELNEITEDIKSFILGMSDLEFLTIRFVRMFLKRHDFLLTDAQAERICVENERYLIHSQVEESQPANMPLVNEHPEALDKVKRSQIDVEESEDFSVDESDFSVQIEEDSPIIQQSEADIRRYVNTVTPLIAKKKEIPDYLLSIPLIISTCNYTRAKLADDLLFRFMKFALNANDGRAVMAVSRIMTFSKVYYPVEELIHHKLFESTKFFALVLALLSMKYKNFKELPDELMNYITSFTTTDIVDFVINMKSTNRRMATALVKFDPHFYAHKLESISKWKSTQLSNMLIIFPLLKDRVSPIIGRILDITRDSRKKRPIALRLLAASISDRQEKALIKMAHLEIRRYLLDPPPEYDITTQITEFALLSLLILRYEPIIDPSDFMDVQQKVGNHATIGALLHLQVNASEAQNIKYLTPLLSAAQPSILLGVIAFMKRAMTDTSLILAQNITDLILKSRKLSTFLEVRDTAALLTQILLKKPNRDYALYIYNTYMSQTDFSVNSASVLPSLSVLKATIPILRSTNLELMSMMDKVGRLYDTQYVGIPLVETTIAICNRLHDPEQGICLIPPYLKQHSSSISYMIAEQAALFSLKVLKPDQKDLAVWVPIAKRFFDSFFASAAVIKRQPADIETLASCYNSAARKALEYLSDNDKKAFAIYYALLSQDFEEIPQELEDFVSEYVN